MNKLINGDALKIMQDMIDKGVKVDAIITDPPYKLQRPGNTKTESLGTGGWMGQAGKSTEVIGFNTDINFKNWLPLVYDLLNDNSYIFVMTNDFNLIDALNDFKDAGFHFTKLIIWKKPNKVVSPYFMQQKEYIIFGRKGGAKKLNLKGQSDVIETKHMPKIEKKHNSQKPLELMEILVETSTNENQTILDPFMGSGTTGLACKNLNRNFVGIELDKKYFEIAKERIEDA